MTLQEAEFQLDRLEKARGVLLTNRTRHMILRAVAAGAANVGFHGLETDLSSNVGIAAAAALLHFHPSSWLETIPEQIASPLPQEMPTDQPKFGL